MTPEKVIEAMKEAGFNTRHFNAYHDEFKVFAQLVRNEVLEEVAVIADERANGENDAQWVADRIRSLKS